MRPGKNGEVILQGRIDDRYVKTGARLLRNKALIEHVKTTLINDDEEKVLDPAFTEDVKASLDRVSRLGHFTTGALLFVYPSLARAFLIDLEES